MKDIQNYLNELSNSKVPHSETKVEQKASRQIKEILTQKLTDFLKANLENENIIVMRTSNGVGIALDNEEIGFIPLELNITVKNLDYDIEFENEEYLNHIKEMEEKAKAKAEEKAKKIAKQKKIAEEKKKLREMKESA